MRTLATLQEPDAGSAVLTGANGTSIDVIREKTRVRQTLGDLPQTFGFHPRETWIYAAFCPFAGFAMIMIGADANSPVHVNATMRLALFASFAGMLGMLVAAALFGDAAIRDHETGMASLLFTSPMRKLDDLAGRFLGALAIGAAVFLAFPLGQLIATLLPDVPRDALRPVSLLAFAQS